MISGGELPSPLDVDILTCSSCKRALSSVRPLVAFPFPLSPGHLSVQGECLHCGASVMARCRSTFMPASPMTYRLVRCVVCRSADLEDVTVEHPVRYGTATIPGLRCGACGEVYTLATDIQKAEKAARAAE